MKPKVYFKREVWDKIMYFVKKTDLEVSGFGVVKILSNGDFEIVDAMMLPQQNSTGDTELDGDGIAKAMYHYRDSPDHMNFWWHSHHKMGCFWSQTDRDAINLIGKEGWCLATVFNHKGHCLTAVQYNQVQETPWGHRSVAPVFIDEMENFIYDYQYSKATLEAWDEEFKKNDRPKEEKRERVRSIYALGQRGNTSGMHPEIFDEEIGQFTDKYGKNFYGEIGKPGFVGQYGYWNGNKYEVYVTKKQRKRMFKAAAKAAGITEKDVKFPQNDKDDEEQAPLFRNGTDRGIARLNLPDHLHEFTGVEQLGHIPPGHTRSSYGALLDRYRYLLEIDEKKLAKLIIEETPPMYDGFAISDMRELICCQEDILEGGDRTQQFKLGIMQMENEGAISS